MALGDTSVVLLDLGFETLCGLHDAYVVISWLLWKIVCKQEELFSQQGYTGTEQQAQQGY